LAALQILGLAALQILGLAAPQILGLAAQATLAKLAGHTPGAPWCRPPEVPTLATRATATQRLQLRLTRQRGLPARSIERVARLTRRTPEVAAVTSWAEVGFPTRPWPSWQPLYSAP